MGENELKELQAIKDQFYSEEFILALLGIKKNTFQNYRSRGLEGKVIPVGIPRGKKYLYPKPQTNKWLREHGYML
jgi:hypothetical protein